jgi:uncharacterized integral membrane protein
MRKNGRTGRFIINTRYSRACIFFLAKEESVFYVVLLVIVVIVLVGGALVIVVMENFSAFVTAAQLSFLIWQTPPLPMGLWLLISCLSGALIVYVLSVPTALQERRETRMLRKRVAELEHAQQRAAGGSLQVYPLPIVPMPGLSTDPIPPPGSPQG